MSALRIQRSSELSAHEKAMWTTTLRETDFGEVTIAWTEAVRQSASANVEVRYLQVFAGDAPRALAVLHILRSFDLSEYMGPTLKRVFAPLGRIGWRPLAVDLAFLEVPLANISGIRLVPGAEPEAGAIAALVLDHVRANFKYGVLSLKASPREPGEDAFGTLGLLKTGFLANMGVEFKGEKSFDDYLKGLSYKNRNECRVYARKFAAAGGTITIVEGPDEIDAAVIDAMNRLNTATLTHHKEQSNIQQPIPVSTAYFPALLKALPGATRVFLARLHGEVIAFGLVLDSGDASYFTHVGLDYARTVPSRAYFNLYYAVIADAIRRRRRNLELGAEAYTIKRKLGAVPSPTVYHFEVANPLLRWIASLVARNFDAQEGAQLASARDDAAESAGHVT
jgi:predicted N-acyltransferase